MRSTRHARPIREINARCSSEATLSTPQPAGLGIRRFPPINGGFGLKRSRLRASLRRFLSNDRRAHRALHRAGVKSQHLSAITTVPRYVPVCGVRGFCLQPA